MTLCKVFCELLFPMSTKIAMWQEKTELYPIYSVCPPVPIIHDENPSSSRRVPSDRRILHHNNPINHFDRMDQFLTPWPAGISKNLRMKTCCDSCRLLFIKFQGISHDT